MLMRDQDAINLDVTEASCLEAQEDLLSRQATVDQDATSLITHERAVAARTRPERGQDGFMSKQQRGHTATVSVGGGGGGEGEVEESPARKVSDIAR